MQQSSATPKNVDVGIGLRKIVACSHSSSQCLLASTVFGTVSSLHSTSFLMIFILVIIMYGKLAMRDILKHIMNCMLLKGALVQACLNSICKKAPKCTPSVRISTCVHSMHTRHCEHACNINSASQSQAPVYHLYN